ncbi:MAG: hypothetical protein Q7Q71_03350 [Verrucomicrobiota bacterium JB023]|nr:hypothetical protein [Verrucomicrobiota bacterium JB023]
MKRFLVRLILPFVIHWARKEEQRALENGEKLSHQSLADATMLGVKEPERIRLLKVARMPFPSNALLDRLSEWAGLAPQATCGLSLRYGLFIREDQWGDRWLIAHECVHTAQYERMGGLRAFMEEYLVQCWQDGYSAAELEREAVEATVRLRSAADATEAI